MTINHNTKEPVEVVLLLSTMLMIWEVPVALYKTQWQSSARGEDNTCWGLKSGPTCGDGRLGHSIWVTCWELQIQWWTKGVQRPEKKKTLRGSTLGSNLELQQRVSGLLTLPDVLEPSLASVHTSFGCSMMPFWRILRERKTGLFTWQKPDCSAQEQCPFLLFCLPGHLLCCRFSKHYQFSAQDQQLISQGNLESATTLSLLSKAFLQCSSCLHQDPRHSTQVIYGDFEDIPLPWGS